MVVSIEVVGGPVPGRNGRVEAIYQFGSQAWQSKKRGIRGIQERSRGEMSKRANIAAVWAGNDRICQGRAWI